MEHHNNPISAAFYACTSIFSAIMAITLSNVQAIATLVASGIAIVSGILAIRYYHFATKEKKINIENSKK